MKLSLEEFQDVFLYHGFTQKGRNQSYPSAPQNLMNWHRMHLPESQWALERDIGKPYQRYFQNLIDQMGEGSEPKDVILEIGRQLRSEVLSHMPGLDDAGEYDTLSSLTRGFQNHIESLDPEHPIRRIQITRNGGQKCDFKKCFHALHYCRNILQVIDREKATRLWKSIENVHLKN